MRSGPRVFSVFIARARLTSFLPPYIIPTQVPNPDNFFKKSNPCMKCRQFPGDLMINK